METSPIYQTKNQEALRIIKSVFDLCFYEISESERALLITQMRTEETEKIEYIQGMLDQREYLSYLSGRCYANCL